MKNPIRLLWIAIAAAALTCAQTPKQNTAKAPAGPVPRAADGHPDLSGVWAMAGGLLTNPGTARPGVLPADAARRPEPPPYQDWAAAKIKEEQDNKLKDDPMARCLLVGVPRIFTMPMPMQIVQTPGQTVMLYEAFHAFRVIPTDGRGHPDDIDATYMGDSVGHWEGDTFVVDVTGFNDITWLDNRARFHSDQLHVVERYHRTDANTLAYQATMTDPKVLTKPWTINLTLKLRPKDRLREYECIENNEDVPRLVGK